MHFTACISLHFSAFLWISLHFYAFFFTAFICISLHLYAFHCISMHFTAFLCMFLFYLIFLISLIFLGVCASYLQEFMQHTQGNACIKPLGMCASNLQECVHYTLQEHVHHTFRNGDIITLGVPPSNFQECVHKTFRSVSELKKIKQFKQQRCIFGHKIQHQKRVTNQTSRQNSADSTVANSIGVGRTGAYYTGADSTCLVMLGYAQLFISRSRRKGHCFQHSRLDSRQHWC